MGGESGHFDFGPGGHVGGGHHVRVRGWRAFEQQVADPAFVGAVFLVVFVDLGSQVFGQFFTDAYPGVRDRVIDGDFVRAGHDVFSCGWLRWWLCGGSIGGCLPGPLGGGPALPGWYCRWQDSPPDMAGCRPLWATCRPRRGDSISLPVGMPYGAWGAAGWRAANNILLPMTVSR